MAAAESAYGPLPPELWTRILLDSSFSGVDFKKFRLVNSVFKDIITPTLFRHAWYSVTETNIANLDNLLAAEELRRNIKTLYIDNAMFIPHLPAIEYRSLLAGYMHKVLHISSLDPTQDSEPIRILAHDPPLPEEIIEEGFVAYDLHASFQKHFLRDACHGGLQHLKHTLSKLPKLQSIELRPEWVPSAPGALRDTLLYEVFKRAFGKDGTHSRLPGSCKKQVPTSPFSQPGFTSRSWNPLHLPPGFIKDRFLGFNQQHENGTLADSLLPAICDSGVELDSLYLPGLNYPLDNGSLSLEAFNCDYVELPIVRVQSLSRVQGSENVLSSIRVLKLWLDSSYSYHLGPLELAKANWLNKALRRMSKVEDLSIVQVQERHAYDPLLEMFKLLLEKTPLSSKFSCHDNEKSPDDTDSNELIWQPLCDLRSLEVKSSTLFPSMQSIHPLNPNPWPKLVKLDLFHIAATKDDLASLMIILAPSLRRLQLNHLELGSCPCNRGQRVWFENQSDWWDYVGNHCWKHDGDRWYDAAVMLNKTLRLHSCYIILGMYNYDEFLDRLKAVHPNSQLSHDSIARDLNDKNLLGRYVLEAKGEGPALWLSQNGYGADTNPTSTQSNEGDTANWWEA
jgi:hypothetical protein